MACSPCSGKKGSVASSSHRLPRGCSRTDICRAFQRIPARRKVIEYTGERISRAETKRRGHGTHTYLFTLDDYWTVDGAVAGSGAEIINHSCNANLRASIFKGHILYYSNRVIEPGEELTVDYRFSDKIERVVCRCGAQNCRGAINLEDA